MHEITQKFIKSTKMPISGTVIDIMEFLTEPENVARMILMTEYGLPALAGVVVPLEEMFAYSTDFPFYRDRERGDSNAPNRRNIGWMVRFVMKEFGYEPESENQISIGKFSRSKHFVSAAVYKKSDKPANYALSITCEIKTQK